MSLNDKKKLTYDLIFLALAKNCEHYLDYFFREIRNISNEYRIKLIIGENGSEDNTLNKIHNSFFDVDFVDTTFIEQYSNRIIRLAKARQEVLDHLKKKNFQSRYICVIDLDDVLKKTLIEKNLRIMIHILEENKNKYFGISSQSKPYYYDILNFLDEKNFNNNLKLMNNKSIFSYPERKKKIYNLQKNLSNLESFECTSSFNGMCVYFFDEFIKSNYFGLDSDGEIIPEHINLNKRLAKITKKKILVTNQASVNMPLEHKPIFSFFHFLFSKLKKYFLISLKIK